MKNQKDYKRAKGRAVAKFGFYTHLIIYMAVGMALVFINLSSSTDYYWVKWPLMGWGIGVLMHGMRVFFYPKKSAILEKMIEKEMEKEMEKEEKI